MKNAKKVLALLLCAVLLVGASVAGTLAFLTDTDDVLNTFTIGNVQIKLDEPVVDPETGKAVESAERTESGNTEVRMIPGRTIDKEPTVTVLKDSEDCYVRVKVTVDVSKSWTAENPTAAGLDFTTWAKNFANQYIKSGELYGFNTTNWTLSTTAIDADAKTITYMLTYLSGTENIVKKNTANTELAPVFTDVAVPQGLTNAELALLAGMEIKVEAHAIQAEGFNGSETDAWYAFDNPNS